MDQQANTFDGDQYLSGDTPEHSDQQQPTEGYDRNPTFAVNDLEELIQLFGGRKVLQRLIAKNLLRCLSHLSFSPTSPKLSGSLDAQQAIRIVWPQLRPSPRAQDRSRLRPDPRHEATLQAQSPTIEWSFEDGLQEKLPAHGRTSLRKPNPSRVWLSACHVRLPGPPNPSPQLP